ncbi:MAG: hypothetical protein WA981_11745 [Glaciecola sp.]
MKCSLWKALTIGSLLFTGAANASLITVSYNDTISLQNGLSHQLYSTDGTSTRTYSKAENDAFELTKFDSSLGELMSAILTWSSSFVTYGHGYVWDFQRNGNFASLNKTVSMDFTASSTALFDGTVLSANTFRESEACTSQVVDRSWRGDPRFYDECSDNNNTRYSDYLSNNEVDLLAVLGIADVTATDANDTFTFQLSNILNMNQSCNMKGDTSGYCGSYSRNNTTFSASIVYEYAQNTVINAPTPSTIGLVVLGLLGVLARRSKI